MQSKDKEKSESALRGLIEEWVRKMRGCRQPRPLDTYLAPLLTILAIPLIEVLEIPNPVLIFMIVAVYFSFVGGTLAGGISAVVTLVYTTYFFSIPDQFLQYTPDNLKRIILVWVSMPLVVLLVGHLRDRLEEKIAQLNNQQQQLANQLKMAAKTQRLMLQGNYEDKRVVIETLYEPSQLVSGDYYCYNWSKSGKVISGCLFDITGHGVASALQTAAVSSIVTEAMKETEGWSISSMNQLNTLLGHYLIEDDFAAMIGFSLDFEKQQISCIGGGISYFLASSTNNNGWMQLPGGYLGLFPDAMLDFITMPFQSGDCFYFMSDGLSDLILQNPSISPQEFDATVEQLRAYAKAADKKDDCTAVCIRIK